MPAPPSTTEHKVANLRAGDWVQIKVPTDILATLDADSKTAGIPFMPEMLSLCGGVFKVSKVATNVCFDKTIRQLGECYVLSTRDRCDGSAHGGCQFGCHFLWRRDWLTAITESEAKQRRASDTEKKQLDLPTELIQIANTGTAPANQTKPNDEYTCQATALKHAAQPVSVTQLRQYKDALQLNRMGISQIAAFCFYLVGKKLFRQRDDLAGNLKKTPVVSLDLAVGDRVTVKSEEQIRKTLDTGGCNRGLWYDRAEMSKYCSQVMTVSRRIDTIIDERTGKLLHLKVPSVVLSETECSGFYRRFCSRGMLFMWRECWLERAD